jgi:hypothetical protein
MEKEMNKKLLTLLVIFAIILLPCPAFAQHHGGGHHGGYHHGGYYSGYHGWYPTYYGGYYPSYGAYYYGSPYYTPSSVSYHTDDWLFGVTVLGVSLGIGASVGPKQEVVYVEKETAEAEKVDSITVNLINSDRTITPVLFKASGDGWVGPQGEYYASIPSVKKLKVLYGK